MCIFHNLREMRELQLIDLLLRRKHENNLEVLEVELRKLQNLILVQDRYITNIQRVVALHGFKQCRLQFICNSEQTRCYINIIYQFS